MQCSKGAGAILQALRGQGGEGGWREDSRSTRAKKAELTCTDLFFEGKWGKGWGPHSHRSVQSMLGMLGMLGVPA